MSKIGGGGGGVSIILKWPNLIAYANITTASSSGWAVNDENVEVGLSEGVGVGVDSKVDVVTEVASAQDERLSVVPSQEMLFEERLHKNDIL